jgi:hypothetical protein
MDKKGDINLVFPEAINLQNATNKIVNPATLLRNRVARILGKKL